VYTGRKENNKQQLDEEKQNIGVKNCEQYNILQRPKQLHTI
jgi:hypothetical protein